MTRPHDLDLLPAWGPYGKVYAGASHLPDLDSGLRFDLSLFPGFYRGRHDVPNVLWESGYRPAGAAPDLSWWRFAHRLEGEAVRIDADYAALPLPHGVTAMAVRAQAVNQTAHPQTFSLSLVCGAQYPARSPGDMCAMGPEALRPGLVACPPDGAWRSCVRYTRALPAVPHPLANLTWDGSRWREFPFHGLAEGRGTFLEQTGDALELHLDLPAALVEARLLLRARIEGGRRVTIAARGAITGRAVFHDARNDGPWQTLELGSGPVPAGRVNVTLALEEGGPSRIDLDVVAIVPAGTGIAVSERTWQPVPAISSGPVADSLILSYVDLGTTYGLRWFAPRSRVRQWHCDRLDSALRERNHDHVNAVLRTRGPGHWTEVMIEPLPVAAEGNAEVWAVVVAGETTAVRAALAAIDVPALHAAQVAGEARACRLPSLPAGERHLPGVQAMAACTLSNVTYPVWTRGRHIRHYSPGKWWDSVYTWDAGFVGLGLLACSPANAQACLEQYLMPEGDRDCAYLNHGTPLPVQIYLAHALWNRTRDRAALRRCFPGLRQMHRYLVGRYGSSDTRRLSSGLLNTFSIFYNSGGWDDYAPQVFIHANKLAGRTAPMVNSSHAVRCARLLAVMAELVGEERAEFDADAASIAAAIQAHAWDDEAGIFSYVVHDGAATEPLRHPGSGANFNLGLDGASPLIAGVCTALQEARLLRRLTDESDLLAPCGLTTVSQQAPYYREDGYWNGTVWFAHNWFFWRTFLDLGLADLAWTIASRGLEAWSREVGISGNCYEHFPNVTGRGAGWHHFTSLSAPVLSWHEAYFRPGLISGGHQCWILDQQGDPAQGVQADLRLDGAAGRHSTVLVVLQPGSRTATWNGAPVPAQERHPGCWEVTLPADGQGRLAIV
jgi:hypothetical protein